MSYLVGIDLGTSSLKAIIIHENGNVLITTGQSYQFDSPKPGYAEQDPEVWWNACCSALQEAIVKTGIDPKDISGVSFSGQMHGLISLDKDYNVIRPCILHCDARSNHQVSHIKDILGWEKCSSLIMNPVYTGFLLPSLMWVRDNEPQHFDKIRHVCLPKDYIRLRLTGELASDNSDASGTLAFDIVNRCWSAPILDAFHITQDIFPTCCETTSICGVVSADAAIRTGLYPGTKVVAGGADQLMQAIGNGLIYTGDATVNIGTSGQVCFQVDRPVLNPELNTNLFCSYEQGKWLLFGATMSAGLSHKWWNNLFESHDFIRQNAAIEQIPPGSGGLIFLPYLNGERTPHVNPDLSGVFFGVNIGTTRAHMERAVMEGVTFSLMQCMELCQNLGYHANHLIASGGGAKSAPWLQMQADIFGAPILVAATEEQACLGAAIAAGSGVGIYSSIDQGCQINVQYKDVQVIPNPERHQIYMEYYDIYKNLFRSCWQELQSITRLGRQHSSNV